MSEPFPLTDREISAMDSASVAMKGTPDPLLLMNALCQWTDPPPSDERWERKVAAACEIAVAFCKLANNLKPYRSELAQQRERAERAERERDELRKALEQLESDCQCTISLNDRNGPTWTINGKGYYDESYVVESNEEKLAVIRAALNPGATNDNRR